ncbi:hypothetical protein CIB48_g7858 [Xylaria polymorpha]|nr:hypothetical protein CIB48_g7858 [Xylaria polymorpha]
MTTWEAKSRAREVESRKSLLRSRRRDTGGTATTGTKQNVGAATTLEDLTVAAKRIEALRASLASDETTHGHHRLASRRRRGPKLAALYDRDAAVFSCRRASSKAAKCRISVGPR